MANEATLSTELQTLLPSCTVADGTAITKGTVLQLTDANTGSASSADGEIFLGIAYADKKADDGTTKMAYYSKGIFEMKCDAVGVTVGDTLKIGGANLVSVADDATAVGISEIIGVALQTGAANETILVRLGL